MASYPVKLFRNGSNQAVRIPREFELPGNEAVISRKGDTLILRSRQPRSLLKLLETLEPIDDSVQEPSDPLPDALDV